MAKIKHKCTIYELLIALEVVERQPNEIEFELLQAKKRDALDCLRFVEIDGPYYNYELNGSGGVTFATYTYAPGTHEIFHIDVLDKVVIGFDQSYWQ